MIDAFGRVRPFITIVESEGRHIEALLTLFERYGLEVPSDNWPDRIEMPTSVADACAEGGMVATETSTQASTRLSRFITIGPDC